MGIILKVILIFILIGVGITIFEKITGINITGDSNKDDITKEKTVDGISNSQEELPLSPLEKELEEIKIGTYSRANKIIEYVVPLYQKPYIKMGGLFSSAGIDKIVSVYIDNQLLFSEKYEGHVIDLEGKVETIGKDGDDVYFVIGNNKSYYRDGSSGESVYQYMKCYLDKNDMADENYKNIVLNMRPNDEVIFTGVLGKGSRFGFELYGTTLIEVNGVVPDRIMNIAENSIYAKYETDENENADAKC